MQRAHFKSFLIETAEDWGWLRVLLAFLACNALFIVGFRDWFGPLGAFVVSAKTSVFLFSDIVLVWCYTAFFYYIVFASTDTISVLGKAIYCRMTGRIHEPHEEPISSKQQFVVMSISLLTMFLVRYAPYLLISMIVLGVLLWIAIKLTPEGFSIVGEGNLTKEASRWNLFMLRLSMIVVVWALAYGLGYFRADHLKRSDEVIVQFIDGHVASLVPMIEVGVGYMYYDPVKREPVIFTDSQIAQIR